MGKMKSTRTGFGLICVLFCVFASGCRINSGIPGSGVSKTEARDVGQFKQFSIAGAGNVDIKFGKEPKLEITADDNLLDLIETTVSEGHLEISFKESVSPKSPLEFKIVTPELSHVKVSGACQVNVEDVKTKEFHIRLAGASSFSGTGTVDALQIKGSGANKIDLENLVAKSVNIVLSGAGAGSVHATESIDAKVSGAAPLAVYGKPKDVAKKTSGVSSIDIK